MTSAILTGSEQLLQIEGERLIFTWVQALGEAVITCGEQLIWREEVGWESYERFAEIAEILHQAYGPRLTDLVPTPGSRWALLGDNSRATGHVDAARALLAGGAP